MEESFQKIYDNYHQDIFQFLYYIVKNREIAEDLVQEVYIKVIKSYHRFEGRSSEKTWLFSIARHVAIDHFRKQKTLRKRILEKFDIEKASLVDEKSLPDEIAIEREEIQLLYKALDKCNMNQRTVLILRFLKDLSIAETAEVLGWTESKVKTTQHRAMKILKKEMARIKGEEEVDYNDQQITLD